MFPENIKMQGMSGRVLSGKTRQLTIDKQHINNVSWSWRPLALLTGKVAFIWQVNDEQLLGQGIVSHSLLGLTQLSQVALNVNANELNSYLPKGNEVIGRIDLNIDSASFVEELKFISATANMEPLTINTMIGKFKLDNLALSANGSEKEGFKLHLTDTSASENKVIAEINQNKVTLSGLLKSQSKLASQLTPILPFIAKKQGENWLVSWQGNIPRL